MKWQYYTLVLGVRSPAFLDAGGQVNTREFDRELNELGRQAWELVTSLTTDKAQGGTQDVVLVFKRPKIPAAVPADE